MKTKLSEMIGNFYSLDYIPNKLIYVYEITKDEIKFLGFFRKYRDKMIAVKHSINKKSKKDIKEYKPFNPSTEVKHMINEAIRSALKQ